jgi:hypothetical protein
MLPDYGRYHGSVLTYLIERTTSALRIQKLPAFAQGFYLLEGTCPIYLKFSRSRKGPWTFNFHHDHKTQNEELVKTYGHCITVLICGTDGFVALSEAQLDHLFDKSGQIQEAVSVRRKLKHMYSVAGSKGKLDSKIGRAALLELLAQRLGQNIFASDASAQESSFSEGSET